MAIPYVTFMKHAQKVTKKASAGRPVLKGVNHTKDGRLIVADSFRLYVADGFTERNDSAIIDPKTGETIDGNYPDVDRLIPESPKITFEIDVNEAHDAFKQMVALTKLNGGFKIVDLVFNDEGVTANVGDEAKARMTYRIAYGKYDIDKMVVNPEFIVDSLALFKDCGIETAIFNYFGNVRPFMIKAGGLLALMLPIRIRKGND